MVSTNQSWAGLSQSEGWMGRVWPMRGGQCWHPWHSGMRYLSAQIWPQIVPGWPGPESREERRHTQCPATAIMKKLKPAWLENNGPFNGQTNQPIAVNNHSTGQGREADHKLGQVHENWQTHNTIKQLLALTNIILLNFSTEMVKSKNITVKSSNVPYPVLIPSSQLDWGWQYNPVSHHLWSIHHLPWPPMSIQSMGPITIPSPKLL